ncbi:MAG: hypothetical protein HAW59_03185 [Betaproteobacteria bacterium]|nr:hypothetical protein [Betaproteobacteria bacterium]
MKNLIISICAFLATALSACAPDPVRLTHIEKVESYQDADLKCATMAREIAEMEAEVEHKLRDDKKHRAHRNVERAIVGGVLLPLVIVVAPIAMMASGSEKLTPMEQRIARIKHLRTLMAEKGCHNNQQKESSSGENAAPQERQRSRVIICDNDKTCIVE